MCYSGIPFFNCMPAISVSMRSAFHVAWPSNFKFMNRRFCERIAGIRIGGIIYFQCLHTRKGFTLCNVAHACVLSLSLWNRAEEFVLVRATRVSSTIDYYYYFACSFHAYTSPTPAISMTYNLRARKFSIKF